mmetsp:Transcript_14592/g.26439  ORF Transcript_14592/g.26439 Transcript_14592/m.26439 type:complete len:238 (-) Transcript_14592:234-947(-)
MPGHLFAVLAFANFELLLHRCRVDTNTHRRELKRLLEDGVPDKDIAVEAVSPIGTLGNPIVVVWGTTVMAKSAISLETTNSHEEDSAVLFTDNVFTLLGSSCWVFLDEVIGRHKSDFSRKLGLDSIFLADELFRIVDSLIDSFYRILEVFHVTVFGGNVLFPIPLINVERMSVVNIVVATKTTEISHDTLFFRDSVVVESPTLPLGKRKGYLKLSSWEITRSKGCRTFGTVEVVVES